MARSSSAMLDASAMADLEEVFNQLAANGAPWRPLSGRSAGTRRRDDLLLRHADGSVTVVEVKGRARLDPAGVREDHLVASGPDRVVVIVADQITDQVREILRAAGAGFFDRRGHLFLSIGPVYIDADVPAITRHVASGATRPIRGRAGITVAAALLLEPDRPVTVRELSRELDMASSSVGDAIKVLTNAELIHAKHPLVPELFWALAEQWHPERQSLSELPPRSTGVLSGSVAAAGLGAPMVVIADAPPDLYVADAATLSRIERRYGSARPAFRRASVAIEPTPLVSTTARAQVAHPLFVALDLAADPSRGREILAAWTPSDAPRVW